MEKSRKPKIRFKGFTDDWEQRKLVELLTKYTDEVNVPHNGYERLGIRSHAKGTFHSYVSEGHELQTGKMYKVAADKFIVNITFGWEHAVAVTDKNDAGKLVSHRFPQYSLSENLYSKFFKYIILDGKFKHHLWLSSPGGAGRNRVLKLNEMLEYKIKIPNVQEQQKIAEVLMNLDHLITLHQRKLDKLINVKKSMLEKMFPKQGSTVPEIRFNGFTQAWEQRKLGELVQFSKGNGYSKKDLEEAGTPIILYGRLYTNYETVISDVDTYVCAKSGSVYSRGGEVIVPASGETSEDISIASVVEKPGFLLGGDLNIITPPIQLDSVFLAISISNGKPHNDMAKMAQGKSVVHLHNSDLEKIDLLFPEHDEQARISSCIRGIDYLITLHQRKLEKLKNIKKSMLEKMFI